ncbi:MAG: aldo/keto reductase [Verrucomicrobia bacterium]|nr:aldo/keto reductase [Verrucomicrobiota bacterium]
MASPRLTRRQFLTRTATVLGAAMLPPLGAGEPAPAPAQTAKRTAVDQVTLGKTGLKLSRLGIGTGSNSGEVQHALGRQGFDRLIRYAYDQGITYIDAAQSYHTFEWIGGAIKGLPREKLFIQSKIPGAPERAMEVIDRHRKVFNTDYIDSMLCHYATTDTWDEERKRVMDVFAEAKAKKIILAHGVSCHGLPALTRATKVDWVDAHLVRINPQGHKVDGATFDFNCPGDVPSALAEIKAMRAQGRGIIGMKLIGNGDFTQPEQRDRSIRFAYQSGLLDAAVIGFKSTAEIDEAIQRINRALAEA